MEQNIEITKVVFRKYQQSGDILALFPEDDEGHGNCSCYQHIGQHGAANYDYCLTFTTLATPEEYAPLMVELQSIGYNLKVMKRGG